VNAFRQSISNKGAFDWTGRRFAPGKRCTIPSDAPPILHRLGIERQ
jgi:hypothetical protein